MKSYLYKDEYNIIKKWIVSQLKAGKSEEFLKNPKGLGYSLSSFLDEQSFFEDWPILSEDEYLELLRIEYRMFTDLKPIEIIIDNSDLEISETRFDYNVTDCWTSYKRLLSKRGFSKDTILEIDHDSEKILQRINAKSTAPIKGLVVGSVQSGKTTNMAAVISKAASHGWNVFVVLSGIIEILRQQTESRLINDLTEEKSSINWRVISQPSKNNEDTMIHKMDFKKNKYIIVSLKNKSRLEQLIDWLHSDSVKKSQIKILIIDDEADQASVNSSNLEVEERKTINKLLVNLVNNRNSKSKELESNFNKIAYVGYTATPYANVLNESEEESLYPKDFILMLSQSVNYFGPSQIFGVEGVEGIEGIDIVRNIDFENKHEFDQVLDIYNETTNELPKSLKNSISYFIAASASLRKHNFNRPVSMLIHTSVSIEHHERFYEAISNWLVNSPNEVLKNSKYIWEKELNRFNFDHLKQVYNGDLQNSYIPHSFEEIEMEVQSILKQIGPIKYKEGKLIYHDGIHTIIDNSANRSVVENSYYGLYYPNNRSDLERTPIFLVIGGTTLSRGLTLEGLITTYFLRKSGRADSLMQMGRWFGYRDKYEIYPRIWMSGYSIEQFKYLSDLDFSLRQEIKQYVKLNISPLEVGLKIKSAPKALGLTLTDPNKMRSAKEVSIDFTGKNIHTTIFRSDLETLQHNKKLTVDFIDSLGSPIILKNNFSNSIYWEKIKFEKIETFLLNYRFSEKMRDLKYIEPFIEWVKDKTDKGHLKDWNIIVVGRGEVNDAYSNNWKQKYFSWNKVQRSRLKEDNYDGNIRIQSLRGPRDVYGDIDLSKIKDDLLKNIIGKSTSEENYLYVRSKLGLESVPQLILYVVDKDSKALKNSITRRDLNLEEDLAGFYITVPSGNPDYKYDSYVTIDL